MKDNDMKYYVKHNDESIGIKISKLDSTGEELAPHEDEWNRSRPTGVKNGLFKS